MFKKLKKKNSLGLLIFCGGCADLMPFSTHLCIEKKNYQEQRFENFYFVPSTDNLGLERSEGQKLAKWRSKKFLAQSVKNGASNHPQKGFPSDGQMRTYSFRKKNVFD